MTSKRPLIFAISFIFASLAGSAFACPHPFQTYEGAKERMLSACVQRSSPEGSADEGYLEFGACAPRIPETPEASDAAGTDGFAEGGNPLEEGNPPEEGNPLRLASMETEADVAAGFSNGMTAGAEPFIHVTHVDGGFESCRATTPADATVAANNGVPVIVNRNVESHIRYFQGRGRKHFVKWLGRTGEYMTLLQNILRENSLPEDLFYLAVIESGLNPKAKSRARAVGMWQFIRGTAVRYGLRVDWWIDERMDPEKASYAASRYLKDLYGQFGSWYLAAAGYNAGEGRIIRAVRKLGTDDFWEIASYKKALKRETRDYVPKYIAAMLIAKDPEGYGFTGQEYGGEFLYEKAGVPEPTDIRVIAQAAGTTVEEIKRLNPELLRWFTPPGYPGYEIKIPAGSRERFIENFARVPREERISFMMHKVKQGETLARIAKRYGTEVNPILYINGLRNVKSLRPGTVIAVPVRAATAQKKNKKELADAVAAASPVG